MFEVKATVDMEGLKALAKKFPQYAKEAKEAKLTEALLLLEREVKAGTPYGAGPIHLRDTIHGKVSTSGKTTAGILGTPAQYGEPVEMGTRPHFPPVGPLTFWVEKKLGYSGAEARSVAYAIATVISRRGTKGAKMFDTGWQESEAAVMRILSQIPAEIVKRVEAQ